ncbi:MAG: hypothetical protein CFK52_03510 [Chloracidobacterium sp. CP2_5A]|nr:MAG: hypothetical protein CFK52_03510 [Chloracidobacterium sp. CP2_5A]
MRVKTLVVGEALTQVKLGARCRIAPERGKPEAGWAASAWLRLVLYRLLRIGWAATFLHRQRNKGILMTSIKLRVVAAVTRFALRYPRLAWRVAQRLAPVATWAMRRFRRARPALEDQALAELTRELTRATAGNASDWRDVYALGELCIRQRAYAEAARHFQRITAADVTDRELRRSAASWLGRALEYAGDIPGAQAAYCNYLRDFPEVSGFERQRLERRLADLGMPPALPGKASSLATVAPAGDRPSRLPARRQKQ